jgi:hypothetical protein
MIVSTRQDVRADCAPTVHTQIRRGVEIFN